MIPSHNQVTSVDIKSHPVKSRYCYLTLKDLLSIFVGITIPVAIGIYGAVTNQQAEESARFAATEQQRIAAERREFEIQRATDLYQQQLYKDFLDAMYLLHKDGELNDSANPWAFANARYRTVHREFDNLRKQQALLFLKEKQMIGRGRCVTGCEEKDVEDIIRLHGMSFDNLRLNSETHGLNKLNLSCIQFDGISMINATFSQVNVNGATFSNSRLNGAKFHNVTFNCTRFENTEVDGVDFSGSDLSGVVFIKTNLSTANLTKDQIEQARFDNVTMSNRTTTTTPTKETAYTSIPVSTTSQESTSSNIFVTTKMEISTISTTSSSPTTSSTTTSSTTTSSTTTSSTTTSSTTTSSTTTSSTTTSSTTTSSTTTSTSTTTTTTTAMPIIPHNTKWSSNAQTISNALKRPHGILIVDEDEQKILVADHGNHRIVQFSQSNQQGAVAVAGGNGMGHGLNQLNGPLNIVIDNDNNSLIICDYGNRRVVRWLRQSNAKQGEILLENIHCWALALDEKRNLYVSDIDKQEVRKYIIGHRNGTVVAGGNGEGSGVHQLHNPYYVFVDRAQSVYVSDNNNHRVMKWNRDAKEGIIVAGGNGKGNSKTQVAHPDGLFVDNDGTIYVVENDNHRVVRWLQGAKEGTVIVGGNGIGQNGNQLNYPFGLAFDRDNNLYVTDTENGRVQRFSVA